METQVRENYREVLGWLRGGDNTPNPEMEDRFVNVIASLVQERMKTEEQQRIESEAARRQVMRNRPSPLSLRAIVNDMYEKGETDCTYEELFGKGSVLNQIKEKPQEPEMEKVPVESGGGDSAAGGIFNQCSVTERPADIRYVYPSVIFRTVILGMFALSC